MALTEEERRRYFRIVDTVGVSYEVVTEAQAQLRQEELQRSDYAAPNRAQQVERKLQLLIDKLRVQNPEFAEVFDLLNSKFNTLKESSISNVADYRKYSDVKQVNISACGISFDDRDQIDIGQKIYLDMTLLPTDIHILTLGEVVDCLKSGEVKGDWTIRIDFYGMRLDDEELMVQHIVKRQGKLLNAKRMQ